MSDDVLKVNGLEAVVERIRCGRRGARLPHKWQPVQLPIGIPQIVCLCGSTRFRAAYEQANCLLTSAGCIVLSIGVNTHDVQVTPQQKADLDELHLRKVDLADVVLVLNVGGYIGASTHAEIAYARKVGKPVVFLEAVRDEAA